MASAAFSRIMPAVEEKPTNQTEQQTTLETQPNNGLNDTITWNQSTIEAMQKGLPAGWKIKSRKRGCGRNDLCVIHGPNRTKFRSKRQLCKYCSVDFTPFEHIKFRAKFGYVVSSKKTSSKANVKSNLKERSNKPKARLTVPKKKEIKILPKPTTMPLRCISSHVLMDKESNLADKTPTSWHSPDHSDQLHTFETLADDLEADIHRTYEETQVDLHNIDYDCFNEDQRPRFYLSSMPSELSPEVLDRLTEPTYEDVSAVDLTQMVRSPFKMADTSRQGKLLANPSESRPSLDILQPLHFTNSVVPECSFSLQYPTNSPKDNLNNLLEPVFPQMSADTTLVTAATQGPIMCDTVASSVVNNQNYFLYQESPQHIDPALNVTGLGTMYGDITNRLSGLTCQMTQINQSFHSTNDLQLSTPYNNTLPLFVSFVGTL